MGPREGYRLARAHFHHIQGSEAEQMGGRKLVYKVVLVVLLWGEVGVPQIKLLLNLEAERIEDGRTWYGCKQGWKCGEPSTVCGEVLKGEEQTKMETEHWHGLAGV